MQQRGRGSGKTGCDGCVPCRIASFHRQGKISNIKFAKQAARVLPLLNWLGLWIKLWEIVGCGKCNNLPSDEGVVRSILFILSFPLGEFQKPWKLANNHIPFLMIKVTSILIFCLLIDNIPYYFPFFWAGSSMSDKVWRNLIYLAGHEI